VASTGMQEVAATERLSDHCPVVVEIQDRDLD
jgi:exonuclease III